MNRVPSLRELRRKRPENVAILPTASPRQVRQNQSREARALRRAFHETNPWRGEYLYPGQREAIKRAEIINSVERTPALRIACAILSTLDAETRKKVASKLEYEATSGAYEAKQALAVSECFSLTIGEAADMKFAFHKLADQND